MVDYSRMEIDFIKRTLHILVQYQEMIQPNVQADQQYEVTLLMNCLLGLLIYPQQFAAQKNNKFSGWLSQDYVINIGEQWGIHLQDIRCAGHKNGKLPGEFIPITVEKLTLRNLIRQMRNATAHINFKVGETSISGQIEAIEFRGGTEVDSFHLSLPVTHLEQFVRKLAYSMLEQLEKPIPKQSK